MRPFALFLVLLLAPALASCGGGSGNGAAARREAAPSGPLEPGMTFPAVTVTALDSSAVDLAGVLRGHDAVVLFLSTHCEACHLLVEVWTRLRDTVPPGITVVGVVDDTVVSGRRFKAETGFPFPLYCDTHSVFNERFGVRDYPTVAGVGPTGRMAYVGHQVNPRFTPEKAAEMLHTYTRKGE